MYIYELIARFDAHKSFYHKATVSIDETTGKLTLYSYETEVANIVNGKLTMLDAAWYSNTTRRHVREFARQHHVENQLAY